jgi:hypothetical protein
MRRSIRKSGGRITVAVATAAACGVAALVPALAAGAGVTPPPGATVSTVDIKFNGGGPGGLKFVAPPTVKSGDYLEVVNKTNSSQVGPHTFSLVQPGLVPKTKKARQKCFTRNHICKAIAKWHGVKGNGPVTVNPAEAGLAGWDTLGSLTAPGDSWFTGFKPHNSIIQQVSAAPGTTLTFMCAIHPWMHGSIQVTG